MHDNHYAFPFVLLDSVYFSHFPSQYYNTIMHVTTSCIQWRNNNFPTSFHSTRQIALGERDGMRKKESIPLIPFQEPKLFDICSTTFASFKTRKTDDDEEEEVLKQRKTTGKQESLPGITMDGF